MPQFFFYVGDVTGRGQSKPLEVADLDAAIHLAVEIATPVVPSVVGSRHADRVTVKVRDHQRKVVARVSVSLEIEKD
jgi:hypothetical protein